MSTPGMAELAAAAAARLRARVAGLMRASGELDAESERLVLSLSEAQATLAVARGAGAFKAGLAVAAAGRQHLAHLETRKRDSARHASDIAGFLSALPGARDAFEATSSGPDRERAYLAAVESVRSLGVRLADARAAREARMPEFLSDPVYRYLSRPGRATANPIARTLDRWLDGVSDFDAERRKHDLLDALPGYLTARLEAARLEMESADTRRRTVLGDRFAGRGKDDLRRLEGGLGTSLAAWVAARRTEALPTTLGDPPRGDDPPAPADSVREVLAALGRVDADITRNASETEAILGRIEVLDRIRAAAAASDPMGPEGAANAIESFASGRTTASDLAAATGLRVP